MSEFLRSDPSLRRPAPLGALDAAISAGERRRQTRLVVSGGIGTALTVVLVLAVMMFPGVSASSHAPVAAGSNAARSYSLTNFDEVNIAGGINAVIRRGNRFDVRVTGPRSALKSVTVTVRGRALEVRRDGQDHGTQIIYAQITLPTLSALDLGGGVNAQLIGQDDKVARGVVLSGGAHLTGEIQATALTLEASGGVNVHLSGHADDLVASGSGGVRLTLADLAVQTAQLTFSGGVTAQLRVLGSLTRVSMSGGCSLVLSGSGSIGQSAVDASSSLTRSNAAP